MTRLSTSLVAGRDYPVTWNQFLDWFHDEDACLKYLEKLRWPQGFICPRCGSRENPFAASRGRLVCRSCRYQCTVTSGTLFEKTRTPLSSWFAAAWYITNQKNGVSALGLQRVLGLGSYQTAWSMLHRLRRAMVNPERDKLHGLVEVDETYVGGRDERKKRAPYEESKKAIVVVAIEMLQPKGFGRVRLQRVLSATQEEVLPFVCNVIESGSEVQTDGSPIYKPLQEYGFTQHKIVHLGSPDPAHVTMPGVHRVASLLKRWLLGTHQGSVGSKQLDYYLDEYTFRFNRRAAKSRGLLFYRLLEQAVATDPVTYQEITRK